MAKIEIGKGAATTGGGGLQVTANGKLIGTAHELPGHQGWAFSDSAGDKLGGATLLAPTRDALIEKIAEHHRRHR